ncbi:BtrH N-terminal domain-containing protein [Paenibacillus pabuli]|uniref:BtrH N-terminal domain-containing protein n=1 Tax=Paenibacillus pabuli TaxID=1472 RepID=UPI003CF7967D
MYKIIDGIEPFNELFFDKCFYNSFFPIVRKFGSDEMRFLMNSRIIYNTEENTDTLLISSKLEEIEAITDIIPRLRLKIENKVLATDFVNRLKEAVQQDRLAIVWIDCFYEPIRMDMYQQEHWPHTLLVYGYDDSESVFHIIEHRNKDSLNYEKRTIGFADLENCYKGYLTYFQDGQHFTYHEIYEVRESQEISEFNIIEQLLKIYHLDTYSGNGIHELEKFISSFSNAVYREEDLSAEYYYKLLEGLNQIINCKKVEKYRTLKLPFHESIIPYIDEILKHWMFIRTIIAKSIYTSKFRNSVCVPMIDKLNVILEMEKKFSAALKILCKGEEYNVK